MKTDSELEKIIILLFKKNRIFPVLNYKFLSGNELKLDFAFPEYKIGIEIQGGYNSPIGLKQDYKKCRLALLNGWKVLCYEMDIVKKDPQQIISDAISLIYLCYTEMEFEKKWYDT